MKLTKFFAITALGLSIVSCNNSTQLKTKKTLETSIDSVSYALGLNTGVRMKADPNAAELDPALYAQGFLNGADSTNLLIKVDDATNIIRTYFQKVQEAQMKKQKEEMMKKAETEFGDYKKENEKFLADNKTKDGIITTASGLQYKVIRKGAGDSPKLTDRVKVHYHGTTIDGKVFDSSIDKGTPFDTGVTQVIRGWIEALQLMKPGAKLKLFIPQGLAYGVQGRMPRIKPFSTLVFDIELIKILEAPKQAAKK